MITDDELQALREMHADGPQGIAPVVAFNALPALLDEVDRLRAALAEAHRNNAEYTYAIFPWALTAEQVQAVDYLLAHGVRRTKETP